MIVSLWIYVGIFLIGVIVIALVGSHSARRPRGGAVPEAAPHQAGSPLDESGLTFAGRSTSEQPGPPAAPVPPHRTP